MANPWFDASYAREWIARIGAGHPARDEQMGVVCVLADAVEPRRILDLGTGAGALARRLLLRMPAAQVVGLDGSAAMLDGAREALKSVADRVRLVQARFEDDWPRETGDGFDLVASLQSVHHLEGEGKRDLFAKVHQVLRPGGVFLLSDRLAVDPRLFAFHRRLWARTRARHDAGPLTDAFTYERYRDRLADAGDVPEFLEIQLDWLREVGFDPVECFWRNGDRAVFGGVKPA